MHDAMLILISQGLLLLLYFFFVCMFSDLLWLILYSLIPWQYVATDVSTIFF